jgi:cation diffusion facilitator family transporter
VRRVVLVILILNVVVAVAKAIYGAMSASLAVSTDAIHSSLDAASNLVGLVVLRAAGSPPDAEHPYGHRKIEIVAAALIGLFIGGSTFRFAWVAIDALWHGAHSLTPSTSGFVIMGATFVINVFVARYELARGRALGSAFLIADAMHTASDLYVTAGVIASLGLSSAGFAWADPVAALVVTVSIARVAWRVLAQNVDILLDRAVLNPAEVARAARSIAGVRGVHRVRSRGVHGAAHVDLHLLLDGELRLATAHELSHRVEDALRAAFPGLVDVTIHVEPDGDAEEGL